MLFERILAILTELWFSDEDSTFRRWVIGCGAVVFLVFLVLAVVQAIGWFW